MSQFDGKILCCVNVASACGYTKSNYEQLSKLHDEFPDKLEILAFPCNQFGRQEPVRTFYSLPYSDFLLMSDLHNFSFLFFQGTHEQICEFIASKPSFNGADKKFVFFEKADVNGPNAREVYSFLKSNTDGSDIGWNFEIFLVNQNGEPVKRFTSSRDPYAALKPEIEKLL